MASSNPLAIIKGLVEVEDRIASFIKGDIGGDSAIANHFRDQYQARCEEYSNAPDWLQSMIQAGGGSPIGRICKPYLDDNGWDEPELDVPFSGGQCPGVRYSWSASGTLTTSTQCFNPSAPGNTISWSNSSSCSDSGGAIYGPISGPFLRSQGNGLFGIALRGFNASGTQVVEVTMRPNHCASKGPWSANVTLTRCTPGDECGDPDPIPVPGPNPAPVPNPDRLPDDEPFFEPEEPLFGIPVNPFPDPIFGDGFPLVDDGILPDGFGGGASGGGGAGRPFDGIDNDDGEGGGEEDFGDPPDGEVWVGAYLQITGRPSFITSVPGSGPENEAFYRVIGNLSLYSIDDGRTYRTEAVQVRSAWTKFIGSPVGLPISGAYVNVLPNVQYTVFPVSAPIAGEEEANG